MLRVSFSTMATARAAVKVLEAYGYSAKQVDREVLTDCPALLAVPAIQKRVGLAEVEHLDLSGGKSSAGWPGSTAGVFAVPSRMPPPRMTVAD